MATSDSGTTHSSRASSIQPDRHFIRARSPSHLRPEDAFSPPRQHRLPSPLGLGRNGTTIGNNNINIKTSTTGTSTTTGSNAPNINTTSDRRSRRSRPPRDRSRSRRRGVPKPAPHYRPWKKLLWVKQNYPDNYTDEETFLDHLQRNPRLRPYEFWPLTAESTIVVQHACSVVIFVTCFTAIFQDRIAPGTVAGWATAGTIGGWFVKESWGWLGEDGDEEREVGEEGEAADDGLGDGKESTLDLRAGSEAEGRKSDEVPPRTSLERSSLDTTTTTTTTRDPSASRTHSRNPSLTSSPALNQFLPGSSPLDSTAPTALPATTSPTDHFPYPTTPFPSTSRFLPPRLQAYTTTLKSATLILFSLLGLSPILKSLTRSYSSDSIWALSALLLAVNIFTFDYGAAGPDQKAAAPLSTNAAVMASTVLASRLESTGGVFGLMLFSIELFGLFPVFRLHLRRRWWAGYVGLTIGLVVGAAGGLAAVLAGPSSRGQMVCTGQADEWDMTGCVVVGGLRWGWTLFGAVAGLVLTALVLGVTSWWLIGLQRYKNEIRGPWDPARPVIGRGGWE